MSDSLFPDDDEEPGLGLVPPTKPAAPSEEPADPVDAWVDAPAAEPAPSVDQDVVETADAPAEPVAAAAADVPPADEPLLGMDLAAAPRVEPAPAYRVLARKYRPQRFDELIGQEAMVQTLGNAIRSGRIAHAFIMTGVRGVGKTSTARLIAKALNCVGPDGTGGPTIDPCGVCEPCRAIAEGRYIDVVEMDAASHTGVDDMREIIEAVRYASVSARFKIYIIDEVHMLSKSAFNALLKTLEEPPAHVKFLFATTEIDKVPVTVLSRCQRFDLKRIPADRLAAHFAAVAEAEGIEIEAEATKVVARAAEGSARDGLSILDQAIAHGEGRVTADAVRDMLGLADRGRIRRLLASVLAGQAGEALNQLDEAHQLGIDPASLVRGLMETLHAVSRAKAGADGDMLASAEEREVASAMAAKLGWPAIHRLWQLLLKGLADIGAAPDPREAAAMAILRAIHAADLPDPSDLLRRLGGAQADPNPHSNPGSAASMPPAADAPPPPMASAPAPDPQPASPAMPADFAALVAMIEGAGKPLLALQLHDQVGLVAYAPGELVLEPRGPLPSGFAAEVAQVARSVTGIAWSVRSGTGGGPSLLDQQRDGEAAARDAVLADPTVSAVMAAFDGATLEDHVRKEA